MHRDAAGDLVPSTWDEKGTADFVTEVDLEAERRIVRTLRDRFPRHAIMAEEGTEKEEDPGPSGAGPADGERARTGASAGRDADDEPPPETGILHWIVDPLDGTTNFLHGYPEYSVSIAGIDGAGLRVAVVLNSATGERFEALRDRGARRDGEPIRVSGLEEPRLALVGTGFPFKREELLPAYLSMFSRVLLATSGIRRGGSAALDLCDLACGRLDAFWELWLMPWDIAAGALIVREAGGVFGPLELAGETAFGEGPGARTLREAIAAAGEFAATWDGGFGTLRGAAREGTLGRGGAYLGANGQLLGPLKGLLSEG